MDILALNIKSFDCNPMGNDCNVRSIDCNFRPF